MWSRTVLLSLVLGVVHASAHGLHARRLLREVETDREVGGFELDGNQAQSMCEVLIVQNTLQEDRQLLNSRLLLKAGCRW